MAKTVRTEFQILQDRVNIAKWYLQGKTQNEIALKIGVTRQQISYDLKKIMEEWKQERLKDFEERLLAELCKLDLIEAEAWEAWEKSKKDSEKLIENQTKDGVFTSFTIEGQNAHKPYLDMIFKCVEKRLQILGFLAIKQPKEVEKNDIDTELIEAEVELPDNGR
jgi:hypothetical protein